MPKSEERRRGGVLRYRTIKLPNGKYAHVAIVPKAGKRGGHTVMGEIHTKGETKRRRSSRRARRRTPHRSRSEFRI